MGVREALSFRQGDSIVELGRVASGAHLSIYMYPKKYIMILKAEIMAPLRYQFH